MIAIIDYGTGNLRSVSNAFKRLGADLLLTSDKQEIASASHVILPGVGEAGHAMEQLRKLDLTSFIPTLKQPVLGICIGMQVMCQSSEEGDTQCLGIFDADVKRLKLDDKNPLLKIPHMGWDNVSELRSKLFDGIKENEYFYYVHSYAPEICVDTIAQTCYGQTFSAALNRDNFYGTQFHPEKSGETGARLLSNFLNL